MSFELKDEGGMMGLALFAIVIIIAMMVSCEKSYYNTESDKTKARYSAGICETWWGTEYACNENARPLP